MVKITSDGASRFERLTRYYVGGHIKEEETCQACDVYRGDVKYFHTGFWWGNWKERDSLEDLDKTNVICVYIDVDGKIILKWILRKGDEGLWTGFVCFKNGKSLGIL